jgi:iron(III) transport system substrate-binding protein
MRKSVLRLGALAVGAALTMSACGGGGSDSAKGPVKGDWDSVVAAANKEGSVLLYSSQNPVRLDALKAAFTKKYPKIKMEYIRGTDAELDPKIEVENRTGKGSADVHMVTDPSWIKNAADSGKFSSDIVGPAFDDKAFDRSKNVLKDKFFLTSAAVFAMGWNTKDAPDGLTTPQDVLDPKYKGKIGITNPQGIAAYVDFYKFYEKNFGPDFLEKLAAQKPRIYPSALGIAQALTSGEIAVAPGVQPLVAEVKAGAPVDWKLPDPAWGTPWFTHVLKVAPHPNAAQVLADFMITPEGQSALNAGYASVYGKTDGAVADASDVKLPDAKELTPEKIAAYQQQWEKLFLK